MLLHVCLYRIHRLCLIIIIIMNAPGSLAWPDRYFLRNGAYRLEIISAVLPVVVVVLPVHPWTSKTLPALKSLLKSWFKRSSKLNSFIIKVVVWYYWLVFQSWGLSCTTNQVQSWASRWDWGSWMWLYGAVVVGRDLYYRLHVVLASFKPWTVHNLA